MAEPDVIIVGGGPAGLAAAMSLGRARRSVLVIDAGDPGHFAADAIHNMIGFDGVPPREFRVRAWQQLEPYDVERIDDRVATARALDGVGFEVELASGARHAARALVLATGQRYRMPDVPGMQEQLGSRVFHCPFCHGFEVGGRRLAYVGSEQGAAFVDMLRLWSDDVTFVDQDTTDLRVEPAGDGLLIRGEAVELEVDAAFGHPRYEPVDDLPEQLGVERTDSPMSDVPAVVATSGPPGTTNVPGVFVAGDLATAPPSVASAVASGTLAGGTVAHHLAFS